MRVALSQMSSGHDVGRNLEAITTASRRAADEGAELVVFPEAAMYGFGAPLARVAEPLDGPFATAVQVLARELAVTIVAGMFTPAPDGRVHNTLVAAGPESATRYDKIHLFDAFGERESDTVAPGERRRTISVAGTTVGLATCYDVRFPSLFVANALAGATVSVVCASWAAGRHKVEQWELLARARAADSTTYVVACDQAPARGASRGSAPTGVGHSMVVDPFGHVLARLGEEEGLLVVDLDLALVEQAREMLPVLRNRRDPLPG